MGLDVTAYSKLKESRPLTAEESDTGLGDGEEYFYANPDFPKHFEGLKENTVYEYGDSDGDFSMGYMSYGFWRDQLAQLAGYKATSGGRHGDTMQHSQTVWEGAEGPFSDLINFSDCEGTIGPVVAARIAKDFAEWDERAKQFPDTTGRFYTKYKSLRAAFDLAADGGAVKFH